MVDPPYDSALPTACGQQAELPTAQTYVEGCPVLPKLRCHEAQNGQRAQLLWNFHNADGLVLDLTECADAYYDHPDNTHSVAFDSVGNVRGGPVLRLRELTGFSASSDRIHTVPVDILDPARGFVRSAPVPRAIIRTAGVYLEEWGWFTADGDMLFSNQCNLFVRRGLFGLSSPARMQNLGPPTIEEIRLSIRDNSGADNPLLRDVEFDAAEIASAVVRPIAYWNEVPPRLNVTFTTTTFPYREMWLLGIQAHLLEIAAHHYRRNSLAYNAAGVSLDDKNKEQPYLAAAMVKVQQYQEFMRAKKIELNISSFGGPIGSSYSNWY